MKLRPAPFYRPCTHYPSLDFKRHSFLFLQRIALRSLFIWKAVPNLYSWAELQPNGLIQNYRRPTPLASGTVVKCNLPSRASVWGLMEANLQLRPHFWVAVFPCPILPSSRPFLENSSQMNHLNKNFRLRLCFLGHLVSNNKLKASLIYFHQPPKGDSSMSSSQSGMAVLCGSTIFSSSIQISSSLLRNLVERTLLRSSQKAQLWEQWHPGQGCCFWMFL